MPLNAQLTLSIIAHETSIGDLSRTLQATPVSYALSLTDGTGANQAQVVWSASRTATTGGDALDVRALADVRSGAAVVVSFSSVKAVFVKNTHATNSLVIGGESAQTAFAAFPLTTTLTIPAGGVYFVSAPTADGILTSGSSSRVARLAGSGGSCTYEIVIIGEGSVS